MHDDTSIAVKVTPSKLLKSILQFKHNPLARIPFVFDIAMLIAWIFGYIDFDWGNKVTREYLRDGTHLILSIYKWDWQID